MKKNPYLLRSSVGTYDSTVNGVSLNEDVDFFEINATKGQRISAEVEAIRLSGPLFDPYVAILDENQEIATWMTQSFFSKIQLPAFLHQKPEHTTLK